MRFNGFVQPSAKLWQLLAAVFSSSSTITSLMLTELCQIFYLRFTPTFINGTTRLIIVVDWLENEHVFSRGSSVTLMVLVYTGKITACEISVPVQMIN